jgi:glycosyltransferase involved in cell wall biosynthesis
MGNNSRLLIFNYVLDLQHPILAHQHTAVEKLAARFAEITVISGAIGKTLLPQNVTVLNSNWVPSKRLSSVIRFLRLALPLILSRKFSIVFSHMVDVQATLISPFTKIARVRHVLWYAHTNPSRYLMFANLFVDKVVTSTPGSCPIKGPKVEPIGQAIDVSIFKSFTVRNYTSFNRLVHIGRFDKSKNIDLLISTADQLRKINPELSLTIIGNPSNETSKVWAETIVSFYSSQPDWLTFLPSIKRDDFPEVVSNFDIFFHAYTGSLDKVLVESTLLKIPVVSINLEYCREFGVWGSRNDMTLESEYRELISRSPENIQNEIQARYEIAEVHHSETHWINELTRILVA